MRPVTLGKEHGRSADRDHEIGSPVASEESKEIVHERRVLRAVAEAGRLERGLVYVDGLGKLTRELLAEIAREGIEGREAGPEGVKKKDPLRLVRGRPNRCQHQEDESAAECSTAISQGRVSLRPQLA